MTIWIILAAMTGAVALAVLWPLARIRAGAGAPVATEVAFYEAQLADIARDAARGLISAADAAAARAEAGRRLLRASGHTAELSDQSEGAWRRRRAASALALSMIPLISLGIYGVYGSPHLPAQPLEARLAADPSRLSVNEVVSRIEAHLSRQPDDARGWELIAPVYLRSGRMVDAVKAYAEIVRLLGETPQRLSDLAEAQIFAADGVVTAQARELLQKSLASDAGQAKARFYLAVATEQDGDVAAARAAYEDLLRTAPADAPWRPIVQERLAAIGGGTPAPTPDEDAIRGMVEGLSARLAAGGGSVEEWSRLIRSRSVLGEREAAQTALAAARAGLAGDAAAQAALDRLAGELNLGARAP